MRRRLAVKYHLVALAIAIGIAGVGLIPSTPAPANGPTTRNIKAGTYYVIQVTGKIGEFITPEFMDECLKEAKELKADVVILHIDSQGGFVDATEKILKLLAGFHGPRLVAYVNEAGSAAAIITLACPTIYVEKTAVIGAALAVEPGPSGKRIAIEEKMQSFWRAKCRAAAENAGHQGIIAEAMIDQGIELHLVNRNGVPCVAEGLGADMLTRKDRLLTLTAKKAVDCGLAAGIVNGHKELGKALGYDKWKKHAQGEARHCEQKYKLGELKGLWKQFRAQEKKLQQGKKPRKRLEGLGFRILILLKIKKHHEEYPSLGAPRYPLDELLVALREERDKLNLAIKESDERKERTDPTRPATIHIGPRIYRP